MLASTRMRYAAILALALRLAAQDSRFNARSRLVLVPVTVTDERGRSVNGLEPSDFKLFDNARGRKVTVDTIGTGVAPIALVIAVQSSGISTPVLEKVRKIGAMIQPLVTGERGCGAVVSFAQTVSWIQECTNNPDLLQRALRQLQPGDHKEAAMLDAVSQSIDHLRKQTNSRRVLLLISESRDRGSKTDRRRHHRGTIRRRHDIRGNLLGSEGGLHFKSPATRQPHDKNPQTTPESEVMSTSNGAPASKYNPKTLPEEQRVDIPAVIREVLRLHEANTTQALAAVTGGVTFPFTRQRGLETAIQKFGAELHSQYVLAFAPQDPAPGYHTLDVRLVRSGHFLIRARPGYWSAEPQ